MQYNTLLTRIAADIYSNGAELITGDLLQNVLNDMVGALASAGACYKGTITPASAAPLDLDQPTVYLALTAGTYTNFVDSNNDPIVTTGPALITYDGGASLVFSKTDLPSGSPDAVLYTPQTLTDPQKTQARENIEAAHAVRITSADLSSKPYLYILIPYDSQELNLRIDVVAHNSSGDKIGYTGSLLLALNDDGGGVWTGKQAYYYGDDLALLFSSIAIDVYGDYFLVLACESSNDDITLTIYPTTDTEIAATWYASRPGTEEGTITPTELEDTSNKVTSIGSSSTDSEYPSAKCVYDALQGGGGGGAAGAVRYDESQSLTDAQKLQARTNIGAAKEKETLILDQTFTLERLRPTAYDSGTGYYTVDSFPSWVTANNGETFKGTLNVVDGFTAANTIPYPNSNCATMCVLTKIDSTHFSMASGDSPSGTPNPSAFYFTQINKEASFDMPSAITKYHLIIENTAAVTSYYEALGIARQSGGQHTSVTPLGAKGLGYYTARVLQGSMDIVFSIDPSTYKVTGISLKGGALSKTSATALGYTCFPEVYGENTLNIWGTGTTTLYIGVVAEARQLIKDGTRIRIYKIND